MVEIDILILAAFPPEIAPLEKWLGPALRGVSGGLRVRAEVVGVGLMQAAVGAARLLEAIRPHRVVLVGTAGAYEGSGLAIGDVARGSAACLACGSVAEGRGAIPAIVPGWAPFAPLFPGDRAGVMIATTLSVTTEASLAGALTRHYGTQLEHLEAFAVADRCRVGAIPCSAIFGVANEVGPLGRPQWQQFHKAVSEAACDDLVAQLVAHH